jgi:hypothetical protein
MEVYTVQWADIDGLHTVQTDNIVTMAALIKLARLSGVTDDNLILTGMSGFGRHRTLTPETTLESAERITARTRMYQRMADRL